MVTVPCIDNNRNILELPKAFLKSNGYAVLIGLDGPTVVALPQDHSTDPMILDGNMPGRDGNQVAALLMQERPMLPIVTWSGYADQVPKSLRWFAGALVRKEDGPDALPSVLERPSERLSA